MAKNTQSLTGSMRFDVLGHAAGKDPRRVYPALLRGFRNVPEKVGVLSGIDVIRYIIVLYSRDSYLNQVPQVPLQERKVMAAEACGFPRTQKGTFPIDIERSIFDLEDEEVVRMILDYLRFIDVNQYWRELVVTEQLLYENQKILLAPIGGDGSDKDRVSAAALKEKLSNQNKHHVTYRNTLFSKIFEGDQELSNEINGKLTEFSINNLLSWLQ